MAGEQSLGNEAGFSFVVAIVYISLMKAVYWDVTSTAFSLDMSSSLDIFGCFERIKGICFFINFDRRYLKLAF